MSESTSAARTRLADAASAIRYTVRSPRLWALAALLLVIASGAQIAGPLVIPLGIASITVLPMVWGIIAGGFASAQPWRRLPLDMQHVASIFMGIAVMVLCARLSFTLGPNVSILFTAGPALLLQEIGHLFGTIMLALPLAVLLRMGPATIGATFSIDREGSFAMVSERYGAESPQYRGVLSMYVFGTLFGAVLVSLIASLATSTGLFDPLALAMGAGLGSGSMMAAAAAVVQQAHPEMGDQVLAVATASNLITGILGLYVGIFIALPLADRLYRVLARGGFEATMLAGWALMGLLAMAGFALSRISRGKVPAIAWVITIGALITSPLSPIADAVLASVAAIDFLSVCTVVLTIAGLSLGKDLPLLKNIGWKIIPVGIVSITASYLVSVVIAEFALGLWS